MRYILFHFILWTSKYSWWKLCVQEEEEEYEEKMDGVISALSLNIHMFIFIMLMWSLYATPITKSSSIYLTCHSRANFK